jgi:hypothetical protein
VSYRKKVLKLGEESESARQELRIACKQDLLFYVNTFVWSYDPRYMHPIPRTVPFVTWPFQDLGLLQMAHAIRNQYDLAIEKSRDMGASWMLLIVFDWFWRFHSETSFLLGSRKEEYVDNGRRDKKSLFGKLDHLNDHLPRWLIPNGYDRTSLKIWNGELESIISGESTNKDFGRGDRRTAIGLDEFAAVENDYEILSAIHDATGCRIYNSTHKGRATAFYDRCKNVRIKKLVFHWTQHPAKAAGLSFDKSGKPTSPWYEKECAIRKHRILIAQELDIDPAGSDDIFFEPATISRIEDDTCRVPLKYGELSYKDYGLDSSRFIARPRGPLKLWFNPESDGRPPRDRRYVIGADIGMGMGGESSSNSALVVGDCKTQEQVATFAVPDMMPEKFAQFSVALAQWFHGAFMVWESNGPGRIYGKVVTTSGYRNIHYRKNEAQISPKITDIPGWVATKDTKLALLGEYRRAMSVGEYTIRDLEEAKELLYFVYLDKGGVAHSGSSIGLDPSGAKENHGDRVTASALCWLGIKGKPSLAQHEELKAPEGSPLWRRQQAQNHSSDAIRNRWRTKPFSRHD